VFEELINYFTEQDVEYQRNISFASISSLKCGGTVNLAVMPDSIDKLVGVIRFLENKGIKYRLVGNMTNVLPKDGVYEGVLVRTVKLNRFSVRGNEVIAECGCLTKTLLGRLALMGLGGAEELFMIPGSLGAMCVGNAGAHGVCMSDIFLSGEFYSPKVGKVVCLDNEEMRFSYRSSFAKDNSLILLSCRIRLEMLEIAEICKMIKHFASLRRQSQPVTEPSLGSFYKRQDGVSMGYYTEILGLKGLRVGGAAISEKHGGFLVNKGGAMVCDFLELDRIIKQKTNQYFLKQ
jgi:UDP-N-acetylmuramate dehydrogenase